MIKALKISLLATVVILLSASTCGRNNSHCLGKGMDATVQCLKDLPSEEISDDSKVKDYLEQHKVYISLTTSPTRIFLLKPVLDTLNLENVENILLTIPKVFGRDSTKYIIPDEIKNYNKLKILRIKEDLGPIAKILPAIVYVNNNEENKNSDIVFYGNEQPLATPDPDAIVISIDDDTGYDNGLVGQLTKYTILADAVISPTTANLNSFGIKLTDWPAHNSPETKFSSLRPKNIVEGYGGIGYRASQVNVPQMIQLSKASKACFVADDLVISWVLTSNRISRYEVYNKYVGLPVQFDFGFERDALHQGGDGSSIPPRDYAGCAKTAAELFN